MSIQLESNENAKTHDNNQEDNNEKNLEILLGTIYKQIEFLKDKYSVFDFQDKLINENHKNFFKNVEKIENSKELLILKIDKM
jgi:hypothetical protein